MEVTLFKSPRTEIYLFIGVLACCCLYLFLLHPISGPIGAALFIIYGWLMPTVIVLVIAWGISYLITTKFKIRIIFTIILSMVLGLNTNVVLLKYVFSPPIFNYEINEIVQLKKGISVNREGYEIFKENLVKKYIFESKVTIVTDASVGEMYFVKSKDALVESFSRLPARASVESEADVTISIKITKNNSTMNADLEIKKKDIVVSWLKVEKIPYASITGLYGREIGLDSDSFFENGFDMMLHKNIFSYLISSLVYGNPYTQINDFINKAII